MKLILGLGNPGSGYEKTRHNVGCRIIDHLAVGKTELALNNKLKAYLGQVTNKDTRVLLAKPTVYMNEVGQTAAKIADYYDIPAGKILVISDDINLAFGLIRTRVGGGDGGHNGLKSIIDAIGPDFHRLRVGVKNNYLSSTQLDKFVLQNFTKDEESKISTIIAKAAELAEEFMEGEISSTTLK